jgi:hypothetical protein
MSLQHNSRFTFDLPAVAHKKLKAIAALQGIALKDLVYECLNENLLKDYEPNKETLAAMKEIDEGGGIECDSMDDFWKKMGIDRVA